MAGGWTLRRGASRNRQAADAIYRYDEARRLRLKTVEIVEQQFPWTPSVPPGLDPLTLVLAGALGVVYAMGLDLRIVR